MTIRDANKGDASSLAALSIEVWLGIYLRQGISGFFADYVLSEYTASRFENLITSGDDYLAVSEGHDGIEGFIHVSRNCPAPAGVPSETEIQTLYVRPNQHGKGIGKKLLLSAVAYCDTVSVPSIWLTTNSENTPAIAFYHSQGFTDAGTTHFRIQDQAYPNKIFLLDLSRAET